MMSKSVDDWPGFFLACAAAGSRTCLSRQAEAVRYRVPHQAVWTGAKKRHGGDTFFSFQAL